MCSNVLVWGARNVIEVKVRHTGKARERVIVEDSDVQRAISEYANRSERAEVNRIVKAQHTLVADSKLEVINALYANRQLALPKSTIAGAIDVAEKTPRYGNPFSVWGIVNGLTEVSQLSTHANERTDIDRAAGKLLDMMVPLV